MLDKYTYVNLAHIFFSGPLLLYLGLKSQKPQFVYYIILALGMLLSIYFVYEILMESPRPWLLIHLLIFFPLLIWCGIKKDKTPPIILSIFVAMGCAAIGYHLIKLLRKL